MTKADLQTDDPETVEINFVCGGKEKKVKSHIQTVVFLLSVVCPPSTSPGLHQGHSTEICLGAFLFFLPLPHLRVGYLRLPTPVTFEISST